MTNLAPDGLNRAAACLREVIASVVSVTELNRRARLLLEGEFSLLWVAGEISNLTRAASGHVYFSLKDESAQVRCVMYRSRAQLVPWQLANGQQVEVRALVSLYEPRGEFQLGIESIRRAGLGRLYEAYARLRQQLDDEGLFAPERKKPLPAYPATVAIVSSPQAAALKDVIAVFRRRAPHVRLLLYPTPVQGAGAGEQIAAAIGRANHDALGEVVLLVRGGGSIEDLWAFNEEKVARALAACSLPSVVGVGHESDVTIADWVADVRAATPTAAAEIATQEWVAAAARLANLRTRLQHTVERHLDRLQQRLDDYARRLVHPADRIVQLKNRLGLLDHRLRAAMATRQHRLEGELLRLQSRLVRAQPRTEPLFHRLDRLASRLHHAAHDAMERLRQRVQRAETALTTLNPEATLARGYTIVRDAQGKIVASSAQLTIDSNISLQFGQGTATARIEKLDPDPDLQR